MLKFYTEESTAEPLRYIPYAPFAAADMGAGKTLQSGKFGWETRFDPYWRNRASILRRVDLEGADIVVAPFDWFWVRGPHWKPNRNRAVADAVMAHNRHLYDLAQRNGLPFLLFFSGDRSHEPVPFEDAIVCREAMYASHRSPRDICMPGFSEDLTVSDAGPQPILLREKSDQPTVGFCGLAPPYKLADAVSDAAFFAYIVSARRRCEPSPHYGERLRRRALRILADSKALRQNFIIRSESVFFSPGFDKSRMRAEYISNMQASDYILCCRGSGNYSFRLYETLCLGRIPIIVDTDCVYPFDDGIDWRRLGVFCDAKDIARLPKMIAAHYQDSGAEAFKARQLENRRIWETRITPEGFFRQLAARLPNG